MGVDPLSVEQPGVPEGSLENEADSLVDTPRTLIELEHLELHAMQAQLLERVGEHEPGGFGAEAAVAPLWADQCAVADAS